MAQRSQVPKFGDWESGEKVPYTAYFDKQYKGLGTLGQDRRVNTEDGESKQRIEAFVSQQAAARGYRSINEYSRPPPSYQAKITNKDRVSSPSWERKDSSERSHSFSPNTHGRSRLRPAIRGDKTSEKVASVPKFGDWDENNPASADGYTHIFSKVREEKQVGSAKVPVIPTESSCRNNEKRDTAISSESVGCWCFPLGRK